MNTIERLAEHADLLELAAKANYEDWMLELAGTAEPSWDDLAPSSKMLWIRAMAVALNAINMTGKYAVCPIVHLTEYAR